MENNTSNVREVFIEKNKFSLISLVVVSFVFLVTFLTAFIATPSFLNRIGTTIIQWNLPLIIVGLLVVASLFEKEIDNIDKYEDKVMDAVEDITRKFMRKTRDLRDYDDYDEYDW